VDPARWPTLDPELAEILAALPDMTGALDDVPAAREAMAAWLPTGPVPHEDELEIVDTHTVNDVPIRIYRPLNASGPLPGLLYLHGGGFCLGTVDGEHGGAVQLAHALGAVVVSVEYRLAPEHPYPAGANDCYDGLLHLAGLDGVDPTRLGVHGQSAGGGLAATVALLARDRGGPVLILQSLGMPELDDRLETPSMRAFVDTPLWSRPQAIKSWEHYLGGVPADGYAAPARAEDLRGLPPTYLTTMELDPLRDEGLHYAMRLLEAGVSVEVHNYPGTFHGSSLVRTAEVSKRISADLLAALQLLLRS
jgi:acetyl esterase